MKKLWILLAVFAFAVLVSIQPVSSVNLNGTIASSEWYTMNWNDGGGQATTAHIVYDSLTFLDIEKSSDPKSFVRWWGDANALAAIDTFDSGAPHGVAGVPCTFYLSNQSNIGKIGGPVLGHGTLGYQRIFNAATPPVEQYYGYIYVMFDEWNSTGLTGTQFVSVDYDRSRMYNITFHSWGGNPSTGQVGWSYGDNDGGRAAGPYTFNKGSAAYGWYNVDNQTGLGIYGYVNKTNGNEGTILWPSTVFISDAYHRTISSESVRSTNRFWINTNASQIYISLLGPTDEWTNSSLLFAAPAPTPTPTPASNSTTTTLFIWDEAGNHINGANIQFKDIENGTWLNSTHDPDGKLSISTQGDHHLDMYADYDIFANHFLPAQLLNQEAGPSGSNYTYYLTLFDYNSLAPTGYTSLYVEVKDRQTHNYLDYSVVRATLPNGTYYTQSTSNLGHALFVVPNNTLINCGATQTGYLPGSVLVNSTGASTFTTVIELDRQTSATPTPYIPPTLTPTPLITQIPGSPGNYTGFWAPFYKGLNGMGADDGELGVIMTACFAVFGLIGGGFATGYNPRGASAGASLGFILACAFKFINVWLVIVGVAWLLASFFLYRQD